MIVREPSIPFFGILHHSFYKHQFPFSTTGLSLSTIGEAIYLANCLVLLLPHLKPLYTILCLPLLICYHILYYHILFLLLLVLPQLCVVLVPLPIFSLTISLLHRLCPIFVVIFAMCVLPSLLLLVTIAVITMYNCPLSSGVVLC